MAKHGMYDDAGAAAAATAAEATDVASAADAVGFCLLYSKTEKLNIKTKTNIKPKT